MTASLSRTLPNTTISLLPLLIRTKRPTWRHRPTVFSNDQPNMTSARVEELLQQAKSKRLLVIGDLMLDEFVWGKVGRISPEAPVPVVEVTGESFYPGGAANVARDLREFVDGVSVIGVLGKDRSGQQLRELLARQNIDTSNAVEDETFCTIVKTRIIALHQQV